MKDLVHKLGKSVMGVLSGFDRLLFRGTLRAVIDTYGLMHVRLQTWCPFMIQICMNGREWLIQQLQHAGIGYQRRDNCVCRVDDVAAAQQLLDAQLRTSWTDLWDDLRRQVHPAHESIFAGCPESLHGYYWTAAETEWASDVRFETMIHRPEEFQVWRTTENDPDGPMAWLKMRRGVADLHRRSEVRQASNARFAAALSAVVDDNPVLLKQIAAALCSRVVRPGREPADGGRTRSRSFRALNPLNPDDIRLLTVVSKAEFVLTGLRNADVRRALYGEDPTDAKERRRRSSAVSRKLALLRAHGLLNKVSKSHDYWVTENGRQALTALLAAANATTHELTKLAA